MPQEEELPPGTQEALRLVAELRGLLEGHDMEACIAALTVVLIDGVVMNSIAFGHGPDEPGAPELEALIGGLRLAWQERDGADVAATAAVLKDRPGPPDGGR